MKYAEKKFSNPIDVIIPHIEDKLTISFGSTLEDIDPNNNSWGVSNL